MNIFQLSIGSIIWRHKCNAPLFIFGAYDVFQRGIRVDCGASAQDMTLCLDREGSLFCSFLPRLEFWFKSWQFVCFGLINS